MAPPLLPGLSNPSDALALPAPTHAFLRNTYGTFTVLGPAALPQRCSLLTLRNAQETPLHCQHSRLVEQ